VQRSSSTHQSTSPSRSTHNSQAWKSDENRRELVAYARDQIRELARNYPIDVWWFDGAAPAMTAAEWEAEGIFTDLRALTPEALINNRLFLTGDFDALERHLDIPEGHLWESDESLNQSWSWVPHDTAYHSLVRQWSRLL
jgi:hypothetical protein